MQPSQYAYLYHISKTADETRKDLLAKDVVRYKTTIYLMIVTDTSFWLKYFRWEVFKWQVMEEKRYINRKIKTYKSNTKYHLKKELLHLCNRLLTVSVKTTNSSSGESWTPLAKWISLTSTVLVFVFGSYLISLWIKYQKLEIFCVFH